MNMWCIHISYRGDGTKSRKFQVPTIELLARYDNAAWE
jgi:hypothetical protein